MTELQKTQALKALEAVDQENAGLQAVIESLDEITPELTARMNKFKLYTKYDMGMKNKKAILAQVPKEYIDDEDVTVLLAFDNVMNSNRWTIDNPDVKHSAEQPLRININHMKTMENGMAPIAGTAVWAGKVNVPQQDGSESKGVAIAMKFVENQIGWHWKDLVKAKAVTEVSIEATPDPDCEPYGMNAEGNRCKKGEAAVGIVYPKGTITACSLLSQEGAVRGASILKACEGGEAEIPDTDETQNDTNSVEAHMLALEIEVADLKAMVIENIKRLDYELAVASDMLQGNETQIDKPKVDPIAALRAATLAKLKSKRK